MFLTQEFRNFKEGQLVIFVRDLGNGTYLTSLGPVNKSILETKISKDQQREDDLKRDEFNLVLNNAEGCKIEFAPPHDQLRYIDNISLKRGEYDVNISKRLYFPVSLHIPMDKDVTYDVELESIFTNYGGGYIDELIKKGEINLNEEFEGKTLLHQIIANFSKRYPSFDFMGKYNGLPEGAPTADLLTALQYFINNGFDINNPDSAGKNLLSNVIQRGPAEVVDLLFQNGAKVQPEFINKDNSYAGIFPKVGISNGDKWNEKLLHLFPEEILTELLNREVDGFFPVTDPQFIKLLIEGGAYPFDAFARNDKQIKDKISGSIMLIQGEKESYSYLKWATDNYNKIKQWKEQQQINFKLNSGDFSGIKDYTNRHPDSLQYIADWKLKCSLTGPTGMTVREIADQIAMGSREEELIGQISGNEDEYIDSFTAEQKQYLLDEGLSPRLISFLEEHTQKVKLIKEERAMLAMLKQEEERMAMEAIAIAEAERKSQIDAQNRAEREKKNKNRELFGKVLALTAGAVIADSAPLDSATKADFLANYATDVLTDNKTMSHTQQWANGVSQPSTQTTSGGGSNEVDRNKQISNSCKQQSNSYDDGDGQTTSHCRLAIYNKCVADEMCSFYPSKCGSLRSRVATSCEMMSKMGFNDCPACN